LLAMAFLGLPPLALPLILTLLLPKKKINVFLLNNEINVLHGVLAIQK